MKTLAVVFISAVTALTGVTPAEAFPAVNLEKPKVVSNIEQVQDRRWNGRRYYRNYDRYRNDRRYSGRRYYRHRDDDDDDNAAAIIGGLALGAIIGGALAQPRYYAPRYYAPPAPSYAYGGNAHTRWCYSRYRSYRAWDNTFQPYYGYRRQCISPF